MVCSPFLPRLEPGRWWSDWGLQKLNANTHTDRGPSQIWRKHNWPQTNESNVTSWKLVWTTRSGTWFRRSNGDTQLTFFFCHLINIVLWKVVTCDIYNQWGSIQKFQLTSVSNQFRNLILIREDSVRFQGACCKCACATRPSEELQGLCRTARCAADCGERQNWSWLTDRSVKQHRSPSQTPDMTALLSGTAPWLWPRPHHSALTSCGSPPTTCPSLGRNTPRCPGKCCRRNLLQHWHFYICSI